MKCSRCESENIVRINAKCSDMFDMRGNIGGKEVQHEGYVPYDINFGGGDYVEMNVCSDCGQVQGKFPIEFDDEYVDDEDDD